MVKDNFKIAGKEYSSRLLVGTGKYLNEKSASQAIRASGAEIVTVAIRRVEIAVSYTHLTLPTNGCV